ncbi:MAG: bifunctional [glutamine synthetase] adenylyltransferase/[glutamine synthetase]-adenylyl-L-tyrosine phosphorylase, partial [Alphaproteobacteria bacterium]|nr:bifunctional [glutamine synthetase] adenylyltransferase/[glutamine synthetase]-adenylyl-L-tyrosine phosphorylase [Alphaproteobacteria bacterium]
ELNYSSDIDLISLFDRESMPYTGGSDIQKFCVELARNTVRLMQDRTADGYVFRTDLRLRPDPSSTPMAVSVSGAMTYYESVGQNWERAALIKARPVAGDITAGQEFLARLRPFIWRKSLDFAAIADIQSVKRQIDAKAGEIPDDLLGYNVKLGRGGIREIEFFGQTQQLIWGGRLPELRTQPTCTTIHALVKANKVKPEVADALIEAYDYLRRLEHRLQMVADQQTHSLPDTEQDVERIAHFMGYPDSRSFRAELLATLTTVKLHYTALFSETAPLGNQGNLVFTGTDDDPDTLNTLAAMGFSDPRMVSQSIRGWHFGNARATRTKRARELITEITPSLLRLLTATGQPDVAFRKFDEFVKYLPAGVQLFSLFHSNPALLKLVAEIMGNAPALADVLSKRPSLFDAVLLPDFYAALPTRAVLESELDAMLSRRRDFEDGLTSLCRFANERRFQAGVHLLRGLAAPSQVSETLSTIAEAVLARLLALVKEQFVTQYGRIKDSACAIMALGKLGARELTFGSDLDLVFAYSVPAPDATSNGVKPLPANVYYERLAQRVIHACTSLTPEGMLYEADTRLRPYGKDGPLASRVESIEEYYLSHAWTFERMALTRARAVVGDPALCKTLDALIRTELTRPRDIPTLAHDILDMRLKIEAQHSTDNLWNVKYIRGGLVDLEFIAQFLQLAHAHTHPGILSNHTAQVFEHCGQLKLLEPSVALGLRSACAYTTSVQSILRLCAGSSSRFDENATAEGLKHFLAQTLGEKSFESLKEGLMLHQTRVKSWFEQIITG